MEALLYFTLDRTCFGLPLVAVERVVPVPWITRLPSAPAVILGAFGLEGEVLPVLSLRRRFGWPDRPVELSDHLVVVRAAGRRLALHVDAVVQVGDRAGDGLTTAQDFYPGLTHLAGLSVQEGGVVLIQDLAAVLSLEERRALSEAMGGRT